MNEDEFNKHRCTIIMIFDGFTKDYKDVELNTITFWLKDVTIIISSLDMISIQNSLFCYWNITYEMCVDFLKVESLFSLDTM